MADVVPTILAVTSLSFLRLGIQPPTQEWGQGEAIADDDGFLPQLGSLAARETLAL